ncbi:MAG: DUF1501 domain-containing protein [Singulisphaera sp.]
MTSRRTFLTHGLRDSTLIALAPTLPAFLARTARAVDAQKDERILVVLQLDGGNDGINTVVTLKDDGYAKHRRALRLPEKQLIRITPEVGLHPAMGDAGRLLESGRLAIVPGVGYPNPDRSHFRSLEIWHSARFDPLEHTGLGWIGRVLDGGPPPRDGAPPRSWSAPTRPRPPSGEAPSAAALDRLDDYALADGKPDVPAGPGGEQAEFLRRSMLDAYAAAERLESVARAAPSHAAYPESELARKLSLAARLIKSGLGTRIYYAIQRGYDTHYDQLPAHARLLEELGGALRAFLDDLAAAGLAERVAVLCFSEFGRRVRENGTRGTDHGTAGTVLLAGPCVRPGLHGAYPSLTDLVDGDLRMTVDFRRVYATVLESWLGLASKEALMAPSNPAAPQWLIRAM